MKFVVKNTTRSGLLDLLCPHTCRGCGRLGAVLCECCKNDLPESPLRVCPLCQQVLADTKKNGAAWRDYRCKDCGLSLDSLFVCGWRDGVLAKLVKDFKYQSVRAVSGVLVEILQQAIPELPQNVVVVPLPTIGRHVRERGLDHTLVLAKKLAKKRGWKCQQMLLRAADTVQVGTKAAVRQEQAKKAYVASMTPDSETTYLLLDDVWTTGASMLAAAETMRLVGAKCVLGVVVMAGRDKQNSAS